MMAFNDPILALDLAQSATGWALGVPGGEPPKSGSLRFAKAGHSMAAHFAGCAEWVADFCNVNKPRIVIFESPLELMALAKRPDRYMSTDVCRVLMGLTAVVEATLYGKGYDVREATVAEVRRFFLGTNRIKREDAKIATKHRCIEFGWRPIDDNAADALALWAYMVSIVAPQEGVKFLPLFKGAQFA